MGNEGGALHIVRIEVRKQLVRVNLGLRKQLYESCLALKYIFFSFESFMNVYNTYFEYIYILLPLVPSFLFIEPLSSPLTQ